MRVLFATVLLTAAVLSNPSYAEKTDASARALVEGGVVVYQKSGAGPAGFHSSYAWYA